MWLLALGFGLVLLLIGCSSEDVGDELASADPGPAVEYPAADTTLLQTPRTEKRNVVLVHLESTRAQSVTPYNEELKTTLFLEELAKSSLLAERAYTIVPHTSKASVSVNCGIVPSLVSRTTEAEPGGIPVPCLAHLLKEQGYRTVFFQSSTKDFEDFEGLVDNLGYEEHYPLEAMDAEGFEQTSYFGLEDEIMLKPSEEWLKEHKDEPFWAEYLTSTGRNDYQCLGLRYGDKNFAKHGRPLGRYLNCIRYQDFFVKNLIKQYKELGLYEETIFVVFGDHGEAFGEHGRYGHENVPYEESLKVPLLIHASGWFEGGERAEGLSNLTDVLPTVIEMLGYEVKNGNYPGYSLLHALPGDRTLMFSCFYEDTCLASIEGSKKYIHYFDKRPDEFFDLSKDPLEQKNLAGDGGKEADEQRSL